MKVIKRNGELQEFDFNKIKIAVEKACKATRKLDASQHFYDGLSH